MENKRIHKGRSLVAFPKTFTIIDIETTGLSPVHDKIIELSAIRISNNIAVDSFSSLVRPEPYPDGAYVSDFITKLTGITNDMLADAPDLLPTLQEYLNFLGDDILVGHNVNFDINFLYDYSEKLFSKPLRNDFVDTMRIFRRLYPDLPNHRLSDLCRQYSIDYSNAHRALSDCGLTAQCFEAMRGDAMTRFGTIEFKEDDTKEDACVSSVNNMIVPTDYSDTEKHTMKMLLKKIAYPETELSEEFTRTLHSEAVNDNKNLRKLLELPITKELRYMKKENQRFIPHKVIHYKIVEWHKKSNSASLEITLENNQTIRILGDYFSHMQKPNFEKDIHEQERKLQNE